MPDKKITRKEQALNTRQNLLHTAIDLFKTYGYEKVTVEQICKKANVTTGAFYHHLKNKAGVIIEGYSEYDDFIEQKINALLQSQKTSTDKILECVDYQIEFATSLGVQAITEIYKVQITEELKFFLSEDRNIYRLISKIYVEGQQNNEFTKDIPVEEFTKEFFIISRGVVYNWCQHEGDYDLLEMAKTIMGKFLRLYQV